MTNEQYSPKSLERPSYYRSAHPALVAMQLARDHGIPVFQSHGMRKTVENTLECDCMPWRRREAKKTGDEPTQCPAPGKMPGIKDWPNQASSDLEKIARWFRRSRTNNFSAVTGSKSGIWVLDVDGDAGMENLAALQLEYGALPPTCTTRSGSGTGCHLWWRLPSGVIVRNSASQIALGIDVRGENGQIVLPGGLHKSGRRYMWLEGLAPDEVAWVEAPDAWLQLALEACKKTRTGPVKADQKSRPRNPRTEKIQHSRTLAIGDGPDRGGFHAPINGIAVKFFATYGPDEPSDGLKAALRTAIVEAPAENHDATDIERYASDPYLDEAIESARKYIKESRMNT